MKCCAWCGEQVADDIPSHIAHAEKHEAERKRLGFSHPEYELLMHARQTVGHR